MSTIKNAIKELLVLIYLKVFPQNEEIALLCVYQKCPYAQSSIRENFFSPFNFINCSRKKLLYALYSRENRKLLRGTLLERSSGNIVCLLPTSIMIYICTERQLYIPSVFSKEFYVYTKQNRF